MTSQKYPPLARELAEHAVAIVEAAIKAGGDEGTHMLDRHFR